ncbi:cupin domain-containing protein [Streptomyces solisilvae]|uniref:cupin domain-containing protein n=1 Tax=Streptomyces malaysiensis TaxID=92644 RepID=UPI0036C12CEF
MEIYRPGAAQAPTGMTRPTFTGEGKLEPMHVLDVASTDSISMVTFGAGASTHWHEHEAGQVLVIVDGSGLVALRGEDPVELAPGDIVVTDPGEVHWHGAGPDAPMSHLAVTRGTTAWHDPVEGS